jgi:molecular chaperone DnaK (HSP70)
LFDKSLKTIEQLMLEQLKYARSSNTNIDKVVLVGGFADSPTLKHFLTSSLIKVNKQFNTSSHLVAPPANTSATGVAVGALMRAQNKENGPKRVPCRSIGVLYHIPDDAS